MRRFDPDDVIDDDCEIVQELGGGAYDAVFEVRNLRDDRHHALKPVFLVLTTWSRSLAVGS